MAAINGHLDVARCLVKELGAAVNQADNTGVTPLIEAAVGGHLDVVRCLVTDLGAVVDQACNDGVLP